MISEICRVLKNNGILFFREHDAKDEKVIKYLHVAHEKFDDHVKG